MNERKWHKDEMNLILSHSLLPEEDIPVQEV